MKFIKWKSVIITSVVCLLPIFLGLLLWNKLPDTKQAQNDTVFSLPVREKSTR